MTSFRLAVLACCLVSITGCSSFWNVGESDYACPHNVSGGVTCLSAREVYKATETSDRARITHKNGELVDPKGVEKNSGAPAANSAGGAPRGNPELEAMVPTIDKPVPLRSQAKVMRVWVAPFEDSDGDLNAPGLVYTEIEPRRWNLGDGMVKKSQAISPLTASAGKGPVVLSATAAPFATGSGAVTGTGGGNPAAAPAQRQAGRPNQSQAQRPAANFSPQPAPGGM